MLFLIFLIPFLLSGSLLAEKCTDEFLRHKFPNSLKGKNITIVTIDDYPPFVKRVGLGAPCGFDIDLMTLIGSIYRIQFNYQYVSVADLLPAVLNKTNTISITHQAITPDRIQVVNFVQFFNSGAIYIAKSNYSHPINQLSGLCGQKVGVIRHTVQEIGVQMAQAGCASNPITIISVQTFTELIKIVKNGTAHVGFQDEPVLEPVVLESNGKLKLVGDPFFITPRGILCNKNNEPLCCILTNAINYLIKEGIYEQLLHRYSFTFERYGICPSRLNLNGTTCRKACVPSNGFCQNKLD